jgi:IPT/TIG domain
VRLTTNSHNDYQPQVSGDRVVWQGYDGSDYEIYTWTPSGGVQRITDNEYDDEEPQVSGDRIVWQGGKGGGFPWNIYTWTPSAGVMPLTHWSSLGDPSGGVLPQVSGDRVVWSDNGMGEIYTWTPAAGVVRITITDDVDLEPQVSGDRVVWYTGGGAQVFTWTPDGGITQLTPDGYKGALPQVSGDRVVWAGMQPPAVALQEIYSWAPSSGVVRITTNERDDLDAFISGSRVVWLGDDAHDWEVYTAVAHPVTVPEITSIEPASGPTTGGVSVVINGSGFLSVNGAAAVKFGGTNATGYTVNSPTQITAVAPAHAVGKVDVTVTAAGGTSSTAGIGDDFTYATRYEQNDSRLAYRGTWTTSTVAAASGGSFRFSDSPGASVTVVFEGTHFSWIVKTSSAYGEAKVTVDGDTSSYTLCDLGTVNTVYRDKIFDFEAPEGGVHTVLIERTGAKNPGATAANISVDAFDIVGTLLQAPVINRYEQADSRLKFAGTWTVSSAASASGGSFRFANASGASVTVPFTGTSLSWLAKTSPAYGKAKVTVDGGAPVKVDLYSAATRYQQSVWNTGKMTSGPHWVKIEWTGTRNPSATDTNIGADAFDVLGSLASATRFEQTNAKLIYAGTWTSSSTTSASGSSFKFANKSGASVTLKFTGISCNIIAKKSSVYGIAEIKLDEQAPVLVDFYSASTLFKQTVWKSGFLAPGDHMVTIKWTGTKRTAATDYNINLDALDVIGVLR